MNEFVIKNGYIAQNNSVVSGSLTATNGIIGNVTGTASFAVTASYAMNAGAGAGFPYSGSAVITGSLYVSGSGITGSLSGSLLGTASYADQALSSSFATYAISASNAPGFTVQYAQTIPAATWSFTHNLNTRNPIVQVYDSTYKQIIPNEIVATSGLTTEIRFDYNEAGYVVFSNGGGLYITGSTSQLNQDIAAVTWSFTHNLNSKYVNFEVYDSNDLVIVPAGIRALNTNQAELYFSAPQTGIAVANFSGISGSTNAVTASYALTSTSSSYAVSSSYAATASYLNPVTNGFVVLSQVSQSLNFVDDAAAAAGGVPLGGLYRNGNFILIRIS